MNAFTEVFENLGITQYKLVGSRAYDEAYPNYRASKQDSDWDYIVGIQFVPRITEYLNKKGSTSTRSEYNNGTKFVHNGHSINIIPVVDVEYHAWESATNYLHGLASHDAYCRKALKNSYCRYALTEQARALYKCAISMGGILSEDGKKDSTPLPKALGAFNDDGGDDDMPW